MGQGEICNYLNTSSETKYIPYASFSARKVTWCEIRVDGKLIDVGWWGGGESHSWWANAEAALVRGGLKPGERLTVVVNDSAILRIDGLDAG